MATPSILKKSGPLVLAGPQNGLTVIPAQTPLTRLNYFDGKFLRAEDLSAEQRYLRSLVALSNKAAGHGVAHGFSVTQGTGGTITVSQGLAINAEGQVILLTGSVTASLAELIEKTRHAVTLTAAARAASGVFTDCVVVSEAPPSQVLESGDLVVITVAPAEALCGEEDVFGKLCEEACVTSTDRPFVVEGVVLRARPLLLARPLPVSKAFVFDQRHLRSRVASAYFAGEPARVASHISKAGLESEMWCLGAQADAGTEVPLAVVARAGTALLYVDAWTVRRERIDTPARRYWQWRMAMRPWDVFLAHVLQFQCQLHELVTTPASQPDDDPCRDANRLVAEATDRFAEVTRFYERASARLVAAGVEGLAGGLGALTSFHTRLDDFRKLVAQPQLDRRLLRGGIVELPSAGYLPVVPGSAATVNAQVRQWMGEGVDLRFCIVRPDFVPHALEEAQHMERISLTEGLDNPQAKPQVDILVPNGRILTQESSSPGRGYDALVQLGLPAEPRPADRAAASQAVVHVQGAARTETLSTGGAAVYVAGGTQTQKAARVVDLVNALSRVGRVRDTEHLQLLRSVGGDAEAAPQGGIEANPLLFTRLHTVASEALRFKATRRAAAEPFDTPVVRPAPVFTPALAGDDRTAALWIQLSSARNPFELQAGEVTPLDARLAVVMPSRTPTWLDVQIRGDLRITQPATPGKVLSFTASLSALASVQQVRDGRNVPPVQARIQAQVKAGVDALNGQFKATLLATNGTRMGFVATWSGSPRVVETKITYRISGEEPAGGEITLLESRLTENGKVLEAGNAAHTAALAAVEVIGAALDDAGFADSAARLLFPPPPPPSQDLLVQATLDWVLFHRRRNKTCAEEKITTVAAARRYRVYHLRAPSLDVVRQVRKALLENDAAAIERAGLRPVDVVEYAPASPVLNTPASAVQTDWRAANPGSQFIYGAIASQGAAVADGESLALARLGRLQAAVAAISPPDPRATYETLPVLPGALAATDLDGAIVAMTIEPEVKTVCHQVLRTLRRVEEVVRLIQTSGVPAAIGQNLATDLGSVDFQEHTAGAQPGELDTLKAKWTEQGGGAVTQAALVFRTGDPAETAEMRQAQASAIVAALGGTPAPVVTTTDRALDSSCTSVTIIRAQDQAPSFSLTASGPTPLPVVRREGVSELMGEVVLQGSGGNPDVTHTVNVQIVLNAAISNPDTALPQLMIEGQPIPIIGQRQAGNANTVVFLGVGITEPGAGASRVLRIRNVRANAGTIQSPPDFILSVAITGTSPVPVNNPSVPVATLEGATPAPTRAGRLFLTLTEATGARTMINLPNPIPLQFAADGSLGSRLPAAQVRSVLAARDRTGTVERVELATREAPDPLASRRLETIMSELRSQGIATTSTPSSVIALSPPDRRILPTDAQSLDDIVFIRLAVFG